MKKILIVNSEAPRVDRKGQVVNSGIYLFIFLRSRCLLKEKSCTRKNPWTI
ncbi:hypothetical protein LEP1GSC060_3282 [Leptospira weilii serovar Ranarum str. ICFT]|uniref:Uncharacterized protein n=1 Tax=Leptospira weilii serovar Ranarum str. ICFT TaxID=1218598 RepID=N1WDD1_9LEPT|nr:hypothetical protein LEP1GSC060_3282 [Leptospira weilii serovar Ranarum str. ICFT]